MDRAVISKLLESDPEFGGFLETLYGVSKMGDSSEVHVPADGDQDKKRKALAAGLLMGATAEGLATTRAVQNAVRGTRVGAHRAPVPPTRLKALGHSRAGKVAEAGLQVANLAVGLASAKELVSNRKKPVSKGVIGHFQPKVLVQANARARRAGLRKLPASPIRKAMFTKVGEEFINGARPRAAYRMPGPTSHAKRPRAPQGPGPKHAAEMPQRKLTTEGKLTLAGGGVLTAAGGAAESERRHRQPPTPATPVGKSVTWTGEVAKFNDEKRQVFGWFSLSEVDGEPVVDRQGDYVPIEEAEKSAYDYVLKSRKGGDMHRRVSKADGGPVHTADLIESMVFTPEKIAALGLEPDAVPLGWWGGFQIHDEQQWQDVKEKKRLGFSVHGSGSRREAVLT